MVFSASWVEWVVPKHGFGVGRVDVMGPTVLRNKQGWVGKQDGGGGLRDGWGDLWEWRKVVWGRYVLWPVVGWLVVGVTVKGWK